MLYVVAILLVVWILWVFIVCALSGSVWVFVLAEGGGVLSVLFGCGCEFRVVVCASGCSSRLLLSFLVDVSVLAARVCIALWRSRLHRGGLGIEEVCVCVCVCVVRVCAVCVQGSSWPG
jgi:hypothetical protein